MLLAEDLLLLLTDDETGRLLVPGQHVDAALAGAQLVQLGLEGRVDVDERQRLAVLDPSPIGDPLLDGALGLVVRRAGKKPSAVIGALGRGLRPALYARLAEAGVLRAEPGRVLGLFPRTTWPAASVVHEDAVRRGLEGLLVQGLTPEPRSAALVLLLHAIRSTHKVVDPKQQGLERRELDRRAKRIAEGAWGSKAVRVAIDEMMAGVIAAGSATTPAGSG